MIFRRALVPWLALLFACTASCDSGAQRNKGQTSPSGAPSVPKEAAAKASDSAEGSPQPGKAEKPAALPSVESRFPAPERLVAIGDVHGDLRATRAALRLGGAIDDQDRWVGGKLVVVQTGDQLDRGDDERAILELLERLQREAKASGGRLLVLNGNHETMNVTGDFRYVTRGALHAFDDASPRSPMASRYPSELSGRAAAFLPGGQFARLLSTRPVVVLVGDTVFAHAGVRAPHVDFGLERLNAETAAWMRGDEPRPPRLILDPEGPVWTRVYGDPELGTRSCEVLDRALQRLKAKRMVIGHNVQKGGISPSCGDKIWRIDVGMSRYYGGPTEVLQIESDQVKVLGRGTKKAPAAPAQAAE